MYADVDKVLYRLPCIPPYVSPFEPMKATIEVSNKQEGSTIKVRDATY